MTELIAELSALAPETPIILRREDGTPEAWTAGAALLSLTQLQETNQEYRRDKGIECSWQRVPDPTPPAQSGGLIVGGVPLTELLNRPKEADVLEHAAQAIAENDAGPEWATLTSEQQQFYREAALSALKIIRAAETKAREAASAAQPGGTA